MKEINWSKLGSIAEVFGSIAVVATLLALLFEIRHNSELTRLNAYQSEMDKISSWRDITSTSPLKTHLFNQYTKGNFPDEDSDERKVLIMTITNLFIVYESAYLSKLAGIVDENEWDRMERNLCQQLEFLTEPTFKRRIYDRLTSNFTDYAESTCAQ